MRPFHYQIADSPNAAMRAFGRERSPSAMNSAVQFLAGGTTLIDLMRLDVMRPDILVDINALERSALGRIEQNGKGLRLGAMTRMSDAADHPVLTRDYPVIAQSLTLAAS